MLHGDAEILQVDSIDKVFLVHLEKHLDSLHEDGISRGLKLLIVIHLIIIGEVGEEFPSCLVPVSLFGVHALPNFVIADLLET